MQPDAPILIPWKVATTALALAAFAGSVIAWAVDEAWCRRHRRLEATVPDLFRSFM